MKTEKSAAACHEIVERTFPCKCSTCTQGITGLAFTYSFSVTCMALRRRGLYNVGLFVRTKVITTNNIPNFICHNYTCTRSMTALLRNNMTSKKCAKNTLVLYGPLRTWPWCVALILFGIFKVGFMYIFSRLLQVFRHPTAAIPGRNGGLFTSFFSFFPDDRKSTTERFFAVYSQIILSSRTENGDKVIN